MGKPIEEPGREDERFPDEQYGATGQPDDDDEPEDELGAHDLERVLDSVRDVEDG